MYSKIQNRNRITFFPFFRMRLNTVNRTLALWSTTNLAYFVILMHYVFSKAYFGVFFPTFKGVTLGMNYFYSPCLRWRYVCLQYFFGHTQSRRNVYSCYIQSNLKLKKK